MNRHLTAFDHRGMQAGERVEPEHNSGEKPERREG